MAIKVRILQESHIRLWGLSSRERLERMLAKAGVSGIQEHAETVAAEDSVLLLRGDFLYDQRIIQNMIKVVGIVLETSTPRDSRPVAAHVTAAMADQMEAILAGDGRCDYPEGLRLESPETLVSAYLKELRKFDVPYLLPVTAKNRKILEKHLFAGSYKGVTDLVTKWLWPLPARWATGLCARNGITPNQVTSLSLVLSALAVLLF